MFILNEVCYLTASIGPIYLFYNSVIISREQLKRSICQGHCVYFTTLVATIHIVTSGLWLIQVICLFEESYCSPALLLRCLFIPQNYLQWYLFEKFYAKCTKELVATPLFVGECVNLQFHNSNCSYSLSVVNFSEEQLQTFAFARVTFGTTTFSKELLFL